MILSAFLSQATLKLSIQIVRVTIVAPYARAAPILLVVEEWVVEQRAPPPDPQCLTSGLKVAQRPQLALLHSAFMPQAPLKLSIQIVRVTIVAP